MRFDQPTAPHARPIVSVPVIMRRVLFALVPAMLCHTWYFGPGLLVNFALTASAAVLTEAVVLRLRGRHRHAVQHCLYVALLGRDVVERLFALAHESIELLGLALLVLEPRVEARLEVGDELRCDDRILRERVVAVLLREARRHAHPVLPVGPEDLDLAPRQPGEDHEPVERVDLGLAAPHRRQRVTHQIGLRLEVEDRAASVEERTDQGLIKEKIRVELRRFFRKRSGRRPLVVPVIMEV